MAAPTSHVSSTCFSFCAPEGTQHQHPIPVALYIIALAAIATVMATDWLGINEKLIFGCCVVGAHVVVAIPYFCLRSLQNRAVSDYPLVNHSFISEVDVSVHDEGSDMRKVLLWIQGFILANKKGISLSNSDNSNSILEESNYDTPRISTLTPCLYESCCLIKVKNKGTGKINFVEVGALPNGTYSCMIRTHANPVPVRIASPEDFMRALFEDRQANYSLHFSNPVEALLNEVTKGCARDLTFGTIQNPQELNPEQVADVSSWEGHCFIKMYDNQTGTRYFYCLQNFRGALRLSIWEQTPQGYQPQIDANGRRIIHNFTFQERHNAAPYRKLQAIFAGQNVSMG